MSQPRSKCLVDGCDRLEELAGGRSAGGLCYGHRQRKKRGQPLDGPLSDAKARRLTPRELFLRSVHAFAAAESDEEYERTLSYMVRCAFRMKRAAKR